VRRLVIVFAILVTASSAHAEPQQRHRKTAQIFSGVGTGVSSALILSGFLFAPVGQTFERPLMYTGLATAVITPSLGEFYAGQYLTYGMAARVLGAGLATFALTNETKTQTCDGATMSSQQCTTLLGGGLALLGVAAIAFVGGMAYDVADAPSAVDTWNQSHGFMLEPTAIVTPTGTTTGVALSGYF
jgi:heme A synthase